DVVEGVAPEGLQRRVRHRAVGHRMGKRWGLSPGSIRHRRQRAVLETDKRVIRGGSDLRKRGFSTASSTRVETIRYSKPSTARPLLLLRGRNVTLENAGPFGPGGKTWGWLCCFAAPVGTPLGTGNERR